MVGSALAFSVMAVLVKALGVHLPSHEIVLARALITLGLTWVLLRRARVRLWGQHKGLLVLRGVFGFSALSCVYYCLTRMPIAEATVIQYVNPVFTAIGAAIFLREGVSRGLGLSFVFCLVGVVLVARPALLFGETVSRLDPGVVAIALLGAVLSAGAYVCVRRLGASEHPLVIVFYFPLVALPFSLPLVARDAVMPQGLDWWMLLGVGVSSQLGQVWLTRAMQVETAGRATGLSYLQIVFAAGWGALLFGEVPDLLTVLGAGLIVLGAVVIARSE